MEEQTRMYQTLKSGAQASELPWEQELLSECQSQLESGDFAMAGNKLAYFRDLVRSDAARKRIRELTAEMLSDLQAYVEIESHKIEQYLGAEEITISQFAHVAWQMKFLKKLVGEFFEGHYRESKGIRELSDQVVRLGALYDRSLEVQKNNLRELFAQEIAGVVRDFRSISGQSEAARLTGERCQQIFDQSREIETSSQWRLGKDFRGQLRYVARGLERDFGIELKLPIVPVSSIAPS